MDEEKENKQTCLHSIAGIDREVKERGVFEMKNRIRRMLDKIEALPHFEAVCGVGILLLCIILLGIAGGVEQGSIKI